MQEPPFINLFGKFLGESMTPEEIRLLCEYAQDNKNDPLLDRLLEAAYTDPSFSEKGDYNIDEAFFEVLARAKGRQPEERPSAPVTERRHPLLIWLGSAAAAAAVVALVYGGFHLMKREAPPKTNPIVSIKQMLIPGSNKAVLALANGSRIVLDSTANGAIARQGGVTVTKADSGALAFTGEPLISGRQLPDVALAYNTLTTPKGGQYRVTLSDGTKVWLNAASSIHFPSVFNGGERIVEITGEAYFEVAPDKDRPFTVRTGKTDISVIGTHFNVMAYDDAPAVKATLLQGAIAVRRLKERVMLQPGQQAILPKDGEAIVLARPDLDGTIAWKNGLFIFHNADIQTVMSQLGNWYDAEISFRGNAHARLNGIIPRETNLLKVLDMLALTGEAHFRIDNKTIVVLP